MFSKEKIMKTGLFILSAVAILLITAQVLISQSTKDIEQYKYTVIKSYDDFEVRQYEEAIFSSVDLNSKSYRDNSGSGFRVLAGYIFGGNERNEEIAMTSPVAMKLGDNTQKMSFMVPSSYKMESLPTPNNDNIYFEEKKACVMAAVRFGGWANDEKITFHKEKLEKALKKMGLKHNGNFSYFGYNPPYEMTNRRNEVVVELIDFKQ